MREELRLTPAELRRWRRVFAAYKALEFPAVELVSHEEAMRTIERYLEALGDIHEAHGIPPEAHTCVSAATGHIIVED